jgi:hypothetical protein
VRNIIAIMGKNGNQALKDAYIRTDGEYPLGVSPVWLIAGILVFSSTLSFLLGYVYGKESAPTDAFIIEGAGESLPAVLGVTDVGEEIAPSTPPRAPVPNVEPLTTGMYVASKNGTAYHLPTCTGAKQIKEENKIWFASKEDAELAGYKPAKNCKGI